MNHRRSIAGALAVAGLLALAACGDPDSPRPEAQPDSAAVAANLRAAAAHRDFQHAVEAGSSSPNLLIQDSIDAALARKHAEEATVHYAPVSADQLEHRAIEADRATAWWAQKR